MAQTIPRPTSTNLDRPRARRTMRVAAILGAALLAVLIAGYAILEATGDASEFARTLGFAPEPSGTPVVGVTQVSLNARAFTPEVIQVPAGTTVTWVNDGADPHTVTFQDGGPGSDLLRTGDTFQLTFDTPGAYDYYCKPHLLMVGRVIVTEQP